MLKNISLVDDLRSLARRRMNPLEFKSVPASSSSELPPEEGWQVHRQGKSALRLSRPKAKSVSLEDRVWCLLYRLGFTHLSGDGGAQLELDEKSESGTYNQIDVVGLDPEVALAIECKSAEIPRKYAEFQKDLAKHALIRERFIRAVSRQFPLEYKRVPILVMFTSDLILGENDPERANKEKVVLLNEKDLDYYEHVASHLGPAAKYQLFADLLSGKQIYGLEKRIPALQSRLGKYTCYTFPIAPEYLLKIAYVSHRAKGKATDVNAYQRMIKKSRLKRIKEYINANGIFPTNIVISLEGKGTVQFEPAQNVGRKEVARPGTLILKPSYRCAWIIDGQHRLFAYSGLERAKTSHLSILAFEGLPPSKQAQLFIDINHEQKSVKRSLLQELYAELNWDAEDEEKRVTAIASKAVQALDADDESPFYGRVLLADETRTDVRCITLENLFRNLNQPGMFIVKRGVEYGPLWTGENDGTLKRTIQVINGWFGFIRNAVPDWWDAGAADSGGLSMNDGVSVCMGLLRAVFQHLSDKKHLKLIQLSTRELLEKLEPFGMALGEHFAGYSAEQRGQFRSGARGNQGLTATRRKCEKTLHDKFPDFEPHGLLEALKLQEAQTNKQAYELIQSLEPRLQQFMIDTLKQAYGVDEDRWWYEGVPEPIRKRATEQLEEAQGKGKKEHYLTLIQFRTIAESNWDLFKDTLAFGKSGNKHLKTEWMQKVNELRNVVMHPAKQQTITFEQLAQLRDYDEALTNKLKGGDTSPESEAE
ncbi:MAG: DGQHR domain-containing protein [Acidobacteriia bacterium]|nr:DGQHR domain-containing protein [Terriglobia bacterium]